MKLTFIIRSVALSTFMAGAALFVGAQTANQYASITPGVVKAPSTEPVSLEFPQTTGEPFIVVRGDRLQRIELINSKRESAYTWKDTSGAGLYKVILRLGEMPADIYRVKVTYGDQATYTYIVRTDKQVF